MKLENMTRIATFLAFISIVVLAACSKFENGPNFSLRSPEARITGQWWSTTDIRLVFGIAQWGLDFDQDNSVDITEIDLDGDSDGGEGNWMIEENFLNLYEVGDDPSEGEFYEIVRLTNKELTLRFTDTDVGAFDVDFVKDESAELDIVGGCVDEIAVNYDELANTDDGSCLYACPEEEPALFTFVNLSQCPRDFVLNGDTLAFQVATGDSTIANLYKGYNVAKAPLPLITLCTVNSNSFNAVCGESYRWEVN